MAAFRLRRSTLRGGDSLRELEIVESATATDAQTIVVTFTQTDASNGTTGQVNRRQLVTYASVAASTSHTVSFTAPVTGNLLVVAFSADFVKSTTTAGWTLIDSAIQNSALYVYYKISNGSETSFNWTQSGSGDGVAQFIEYDGLTASPLDVHTSLATGSGTVFGTGTTGATAQDYELVLAFFSAAEPVTFDSYTSGFTELADTTANTSGFPVSQAVAQKLQTATGTEVAAATSTPSVSARQAVIVTFKATRTTPPDTESEIAGLLIPFAVSGSDHGVSTANFFGNTTPGTPDSGDTADVVVGMNWTPSISGYVSGVRFYKHSSAIGTHIGYLWTTDINTPASSVLISSTTFTNETASGWQYQAFSSPIAVVAGTYYTVGVYFPGGHYSADGSYFGTSVSGPLTAPINVSNTDNGLYVYTSSPPVAPFHQFAHTNYYIDVTFGIPETQNVSPVMSDSGSGAEAWSIVASFTATETPSGAEAVTQTQTLADTGSGVDNATIAETASGESATATEAESSVASFTTTEDAAATELEVISIAQSETGSAVDAESVEQGTASVNEDDPATGVEGTPNVSTIVAEAPSLVDAATVAATVAPDTGSATEAETSTATLSPADTSAGSDAEASTASFASSETGSTSDAATIVVAVVPGGDVFQAQDSAALSLAQTEATAESTDSQTLSAHLTVVEAGVGTEAPPAEAQAEQEFATGVEASSSVATLATQADTASASDTQLQLIPTQDQVTLTEVEVASATIVGTDSSSSAELLAVATTGADTATAAENVSVVRQVSESDDGSGSETGALALGGADVAAGTDATIVAASLASNDLCGSSEAESVFVSGLAFSQADTGSAAETISITVHATDTGSGVEASLVAQFFQFSDSASVHEGVALFKPEPFYIASPTRASVEPVGANSATI